VITMVARDDLADGGALHLKLIMQKIKEVNPESSIEILTSDFMGNLDALKLVLEEQPVVFNHNIETVRSLTSKVRHTATYERSLSVLKYAKDSGLTKFVKSGIMLGLGEKDDEVLESLRDLKEIGCAIVTLGQYLQPSHTKTRVKAFIPPEKFTYYKEYGEKIGIKYVYAGPFIRSSYNADNLTTIALGGASLNG
jgi:lipoic acid synthetase